MKKIIIAVVVVVLALGGYLVYNNFLITKNAPITNEAPVIVPNNSDAVPVENNVPTNATPQAENIDTTKTVIGKSIDGTNIMAYHYGTGDTELLFVGGIHGGYEWNTVLLAYSMMDYVKENPSVIPKNVKVTIIPVLNPDGLMKVVGTTEKFAQANVSTDDSVLISGRFNARTVDLNRNFDCDWKSSGVWQNKTVSGGSEAFSEPESKAVRDYIQKHTPAGVVVWYSAAGGVFSSSCHDGVLDETNTLTNLYASASGYKAYNSFNFYEITGDMVNWLAKEGIPAISVLLTNHTDIEWDKNKAGIDAFLMHYKK